MEFETVVDCCCCYLHGKGGFLCIFAKVFNVVPDLKGAY